MTTTTTRTMMPMVLCATTFVSRIHHDSRIVQAVSPATMIAETLVAFLAIPVMVVVDKDVVVAEVRILGVTMAHRVIQTHVRLAVSLAMMLWIVGSSKTP